MLKLFNSIKELEHKEQQQQRQETGRKKEKVKKKRQLVQKTKKNPLTGILPFQSLLSRNNKFTSIEEHLFLD